MNRWKKVPLLKRFERKYIPEPNSGCWLWVGHMHEGGYGEFREKNKRIRAHVWSYRTFKGKIPRNLFVLHHCDVRCCVNPDHLYAGSKWQNSQDAKKRNRYPRGETHAHTKVLEKDVISIRNDDRPQHVIAEDYGVCQMTVCNIKLRRTWKHVP